MDCLENKIWLVTSEGNVRVGEKCSLGLRISNDFGFVNDAYIVINMKGGLDAREVKMEYISTQDNVSYFNCDVYFQNVGLHYFCFKFVINGDTKLIKLNPKTQNPCITDKQFPYWSVTVYEKDFHVPNWARGKIMYHIMVDRFYRSDSYVPEKIDNRITNNWGDMPRWCSDKKNEVCNNDFFMGNLKGIEEKIPYLKELGVQILYLSPICKSQSNHRYDTADYEVVDPYLGTNSSLQSLCNTLHENGMKIIIDAVFNHTGNDSKYFNQYNNYNTVGAYQSTESPYYDWYKKNKNGDFEYWWGFKNLPVCDCNNINWQQYIYGENGVIDKWFELGIDGIRLDVADELTDEFIENIRIAVKRNKPDGFIIGEVWDNAITKEGYGKQRKYLLGKGLDSVMNYPFTNAILKYVRFGNYEYLKETLTTIYNQYPKEVINSLMNSISTHDITRAITTLVGDGIQNNKFNWIWDVPYSRQWQYKNDKLDFQIYNKGVQMMKIATTIQYFLPGNPCIYYGDEAGLYGYKDPFNRKCFMWDNIDNNLHTFFSELGKIKNQHDFLSDADFKEICLNENVFAFERFDEHNRILIAVNRSEMDVPIDFMDSYKNCYEILFKENASDDLLCKYGIIIFYLK